MQFNTNSDFPAQNLPKEQWGVVARQPISFEEAKYIPCVCITTRILINVNSALAAGLSNFTDIQVNVGTETYTLLANPTNVHITSPYPPAAPR